MGAEGDQHHLLALQWMLNLVLVHLLAQPSKPSLLSLHLGIVGSQAWLP